MKKLIIFLLFSMGVDIYAQDYIADHTKATEQVLRNIPQKYIDKARKEFKIAYQHTSHGTHVSRGLFGLQDYKDGDEFLFAITNNAPENNKLDFNDYALQSYAAEGQDASDLSRNEIAFIQASRNFLDDPKNAHINVVMWSWCNIYGHNVTGNYLPGMQALIDEYGEGGSKIGTGEGKREAVVHFIFMTGHANQNANLGDGKPKNQADLITNYCKSNKYYCLDYYSIDAHDMEGEYWDDAGDDGNSTKYGGTGKFYQDFQDLYTVGDGYYENKELPGGNVAFGAHNTQHITANRKAYAMWWILARLAGYNEDIGIHDERIGDLVYYNSISQEICIKTPAIEVDAVCKVYDLTGQLFLQQKFDSSAISLKGLSNGLYVVSIETYLGRKNMKVLIQ